jgi:glutamate dehydrogenase/leucine dehydrogenase
MRPRRQMKDPKPTQGGGTLCTTFQKIIPSIIVPLYMSLSKLKVAVIGLGSAGQAASIFLKRNGHNVEARRNKFLTALFRLFFFFFFLLI